MINIKWTIDRGHNFLGGTWNLAGNIPYSSRLLQNRVWTRTRAIARGSATRLLVDSSQGHNLCYAASGIGGTIQHSSRRLQNLMWTCTHAFARGNLLNRLLPYRCKWYIVGVVPVH